MGSRDVGVALKEYTFLHFHVLMYEMKVIKGSVMIDRKSILNVIKTPKGHR